MAGPSKFFDIAPDHVIAQSTMRSASRSNTVKLKIGGGEGGHNRLPRYLKALATKDYLRVRVGVKPRPRTHGYRGLCAPGFCTAAEKKELPFLLDEAADAVELLVNEGLLAAQKHHAARS